MYSTYTIAVQVFTRISEGSTHGEHGRFLRAVLSKGPYIPRAGTFLRFSKGHMSGMFGTHSC